MEQDSNVMLLTVNLQLAKGIGHCPKKQNFSQDESMNSQAPA